MWRVLSPFVDEKVKASLIFNKEARCDRLIEWFHPSQLEVRYGGEAPNVTKFWPPPMPDSLEYGVDEAKLKDMGTQLVSTAADTVIGA